MNHLAVTQKKRPVLTWKHLWNCWWETMDCLYNNQSLRFLAFSLQQGYGMCDLVSLSLSLPFSSKTYKVSLVRHKRSHVCGWRYMGIASIWTVRQWNQLPWELVSAPTLKAFEKNIDNHLADMLWLYSCIEQGFELDGLVGPFELHFSMILL